MRVAVCMHLLHFCFYGLICFPLLLYFACIRLLRQLISQMQYYAVDTISQILRISYKMQFYDPTQTLDHSNFSCLLFLFDLELSIFLLHGVIVTKWIYQVYYVCIEHHQCSINKQIYNYELRSMYFLVTPVNHVVIFRLKLCLKKFNLCCRRFVTPVC